MQVSCMVEAMKRTHLPSSLIRRAAYDRLVPQGSDSGYLHWLQIKQRQFEAAFPQHRKRGDESRRAFDSWLEGLK